MQDRPEAPDLLDAVADLLMKEVMPLVKDNDAVAYKTLVSWNMLGVVARELRNGEAADNRELENVVKLLGETNPGELATAGEKREALSKLNHKLADKIRSDKTSDPDSEAWKHVKEMLKDKLNIANPRFTQD